MARMVHCSPHSWLHLQIATGQIFLGRALVWKGWAGFPREREVPGLALLLSLLLVAVRPGGGAGGGAGAGRGRVLASLRLGAGLAQAPAGLGRGRALTHPQRPLPILPDNLTELLFSPL